MKRKITLIGAGSVVFAKTLIGDILRFPELADTTICLMDIDPARLKVADVMMRRIAAMLNVPARIEATLDQREAIHDANYVICTIQVGGYKPSTVRDFEIPKQYGLRQTIADTLGVGGVFRALRTIPVINAIARDIAELGKPGCMLLNYTNPMAMNCRAVAEGVGIPFVGLCHSVFGTANQLCRFANLPPEDVSYLVAGINHMAFFLKFQYRGQDAYPLLFKALEDPERIHEKVRFEMMRRTGYFVTESSEHQSEYVPYFIHHGAQQIERFAIPIDEYIRRCEAITATWHETEAELLGKNGQVTLNPQSHEYGSYIIHSIESGTPRTVYGNVPNHGAIENLPYDAIVEVPCLVDATGLHPVNVGALPPQLAALCQSNINVQELTVQAALTGKREYIYHAVMMDPHTSATLPLDKIWAMCDDLIAAHQKDGYLGSFSPVVKNTGRGFAGIGDRVIARLEGVGAFETAAGAENTVRLRVENPCVHAQTLAFALTGQDDAVDLGAASRQEIAVAGQSSVQTIFKLRNAAAITGPYRIELSCEADGVLSVGAVLRPRQHLMADNDGRATFAMKLAGFDAVSGQLWRGENGDFCVKVKVNDSDIKPNPIEPINGSCVQLLFADPEHPERTRQVVFMPAKLDQGEPLAWMDGKPLEGAKLSQRTTASYYEATVELPPRLLHLSEKTSAILFDCICHVGALGDAHSGGRTGLGGKTDARAGSGHYAWLAWR